MSATSFDHEKWFHGTYWKEDMLCCWIYAAPKNEAQKKEQEEHFRVFHL